MNDDAPVQNLGKTLAAEFSVAVSKRSAREQVWLDDLTLCKGKYDDKTLARIVAAGGSQLNIRLTKKKVKVLLARLMDLLFPANGEKNWGIKPTPDPHLSDEQTAEFIQAFTQQAGRAPGPVELQTFVREACQKKADRMAKVIEDQLAETPQRSGYRQEVKKVLKSGLIYGTGIFKGPLVFRETRQAWVRGTEIDPDTGQPAYSLRDVPGELRPYYEFVPIWNIYPEPDAVEVKDCRYFWHEHLMSSSDLLARCTKEQCFDVERIRAYMLIHKQGDAQMHNYEQQLRSIGADDTPCALDNRYRVMERWGYISAEDLIRAGVDLPENSVDEYYANAWLLGDEVIKCVLNPVDGVKSYFYFWHYDKDETSIWGEGVPADMRDPAGGFNAAVRKTVDSYSISGPMFGVNTAALSPGEDVTDIHGNKVFAFESAEDMRKAIVQWNVPADISGGLAMAKFFQEFGDEVSAPKFLQGSTPRGAGGDTAAGMSMLMGAEGVNLKDLVKDYDDNITSPFLGSIYHWNMNFSKDPEIMGDYEVEARGSTALMAREVRSQKLLQAMQVTESPRFAPRVDDDKLLRELFKSIEVDAEMVKPKAEFEADQQKQMARQAAEVAKAQVTEIMNEMRARGLQPEEILPQMLGQSVQQVAQAERGQQV